MKPHRVANSLRILSNYLKPYELVWSSRDHHLKVSFFNYLYITNQYYTVKGGLVRHLIDWLKSTTGQSTPISAIYRLRIRFEFLFKFSPLVSFNQPLKAGWAIARGRGLVFQSIGRFRARETCGPMMIAGRLADF